MFSLNGPSSPVVYQKLFFLTADGVALLQNSMGLHFEYSVRAYLKLHTTIPLFPLLTPPALVLLDHMVQVLVLQSGVQSPAQFLLQAGRLPWQLIHGHSNPCTVVH